MTDVLPADPVSSRLLRTTGTSSNLLSAFAGKHFPIFRRHPSLSNRFWGPLYSPQKGEGEYVTEFKKQSTKEGAAYTTPEMGSGKRFNITEASSSPEQDPEQMKYINPENGVIKSITP